jgi:hypothetical protein
LPSGALPANLTPGSYYFIVKSDSANAVLEENESNNPLSSAAASVAGLPGGGAPATRPDIAVSDLVAPSETISGQTFAVSWTLTNQGDAATDRTWYDAVYLSRDQVFDRSTRELIGQRRNLADLGVQRADDAHRVVARPLDAVDALDRLVQRLDAEPVQRDGEQSLSLGIGLNIKREHARFDLNASGSKLRIVEHPADTDAGSRLALDLAPAFDATFDQVAHRKAHVGLESVDTARVQPVAQLGYIGRCRDFKLAHRCAIEGVLASGLWLRCAQREHTLDIVRANIKVRALPVVADQKGPAIHQSTEEMHYRHATPVRRGNNAITRLQNEPVRFHDPSHFAPTSQSRPGTGWERSEVSWPRSVVSWPRSFL